MLTDGGLHHIRKDSSGHQCDVRASNDFVSTLLKPLRGDEQAMMSADVAYRRPKGERRKAAGAGTQPSAPADDGMWLVASA
jgi:hypothetical protein